MDPLKCEDELDKNRLQNRKLRHAKLESVICSFLDRFQVNINESFRHINKKPWKETIQSSQKIYGDRKKECAYVKYLKKNHLIGL